MKKLKDKKYFVYIIVISCIHYFVFLYIGYTHGFIKNPYNTDAISTLINTTIQILSIIGIELIRTIIVKKYKNNKIALIILTTILILLELKYNVLIKIFTDKEKLFKYICSTIIPLIANNILYTYFALKEAYSVTFLYRIIKELNILLIPIVPKTDWFINGSTNILLTAIMYIIFKYKIIKQKTEEKDINEKISYLLTLILSIALISFMLGAFKYEPIAVLSNSMNPTFNRGDIIIFKKIKDDELKEIPEKSIIVYSIGEKNIVHRVVKRIEENNNIQYQTQGDSNNMADTNLVKPDQIKGIGYPSVWLYDYFQKE